MSFSGGLNLGIEGPYLLPEIGFMRTSNETILLHISHKI